MESINQEVNSTPLAPPNVQTSIEIPSGVISENAIISSSPALRAGNTTENLQPSFGPRTSEVIHASTISNKPEPVEDEAYRLGNEVVASFTRLGDAVAAQGEQLNRASILEAATLPNPSAHAVETAKSFAQKIMSGDVDPEAVAKLKAEVADLKLQINDSFSEVANLLLDLATRFDLLDERINRYNMKSSHKI